MFIVHVGKMRAIHSILATAAFLVEKSASTSGGPFDGNRFSDVYFNGRSGPVPERPHAYVINHLDKLLGTFMASLSAKHKEEISGYMDCAKGMDTEKQVTLKKNLILVYRSEGDDREALRTDLLTKEGYNYPC